MIRKLNANCYNELPSPIPESPPASPSIKSPAQPVSPSPLKPADKSKSTKVPSKDAAKDSIS